MAEYEVDVKAFISIRVEAASKAEARKIADDLVRDNLSPGPEKIAELLAAGVRFKTNGFDVDGTSEVEEVPEEERELTAQTPANDASIEFADLRVEGARFAVELEHIGEGEDGDYQPSDPNDRPLIRFATQQRVDGEWEDVDAGSYCTQVDARCSPEEARLVADHLLTTLERRGPSESLKRLCEELSWTTLESIKKAA